MESVRWNCKRSRVVAVVLSCFLTFISPGGDACSPGKRVKSVSDIIGDAKINGTEGKRFWGEKIPVPQAPGEFKCKSYRGYTESLPTSGKFQFREFAFSNDEDSSAESVW